MVKHLNIEQLRRISREGEVEELTFSAGVNLIVGRPNAGKSQWVRMLDYVLGDPETFERRFSPDISYKYEALEARLSIGAETFDIARLLSRERSRTKVMVDGRVHDTLEFQHWLMAKLEIPLVRYPKGVMSLTKSWPELSFRTLYRHIYRQQRFWNDLADKQYASESNACVLQFLGLARLIFSEDTERLRELRARSDRSSIEIVGSEIAIDAVLALADADVPRDQAASGQAHDEMSADLRTRNATLRALVAAAAGAPDADRLASIERLVESAMAVGGLSERLRILGFLAERRGRFEADFERLAAIIAQASQTIYTQDLTDLIRDRTHRLSTAMNEYFDILNTTAPGFWRHSDVHIRSFRRNELALCVGPMLWSRALGGTDSLLFLMAYHYGLLTLAAQDECHYPGFLVIDLPAYFRGEAVSKLESQIVAPFADLLATDAYAGCQAIFVGAAFEGERRGNRIEITGSHLH